MIDRKLLTLFAYYTCKQRKVQRIQKRALHIAQESSVEGLMNADIFEKLFVKIFELASTKLLKAMAEVGYWED